jgi:uroporphyrinogen decarboxylase
MINPLLDAPSPDFAGLERMLRGEVAPQRVHLVELGIDGEILEAISERALGKPQPPTGPRSWRVFGAPALPGECSFSADEEGAHLEWLIDMWYRLGYDYVPMWPIFTGHPPVRQRRMADDTADLPHAQRTWVDEQHGLIRSWEDFERFPWDAIQPDAGGCEYAVAHLPTGMKVAAVAVFYEHVMENLLGYEGLFYLLHDDPELVGQVFERWGQKVYEYYQAVVGLEGVGVLFHGDDLGYKTATLLPPEALRRHVFPWFRRFAELAHAHGKMVWYHCCGNIYRDGLIEDLIDVVGIDALHSFQDVVLPVAEFKARYGERVAALGGADVDKLARLPVDRVRAYVREILDRCVPGSRFAMGSGNSVTNYVPVENYCAMLEECRRWRPA